MPTILTPNVPNVPGVPALVRGLSDIIYPEDIAWDEGLAWNEGMSLLPYAAIPTEASLLNAAVSYVTDYIFGANLWGVYDKNNIEVLNPDSFLGVDFRNNSRVAMHPVEAGGFESYNKVNTPYDCKVKMAIGGSKSKRAAFLDTCEQMLKSVELFSVVTPEKIYLNSTLQNYSYRRESRSGVTLLTVDLWFLEVRVNPAPEKDEPAEASGADVESSGQVQTQSYKIADEIIYGSNDATEVVEPTWFEWKVL